MCPIGFNDGDDVVIKGPDGTSAEVVDGRLLVSTDMIIKVTINWLGDWDSGTTYLVNDAVHYNGSSWICLQEHSNQTPAENAYWSYIAQKGDKGDKGDTGDTGPAAVAGELPNSYVEYSTPQGTTSATLVDVTGMSTTIHLDETVHIAVVASFELQTQSGAASSTIAVAINIDGTDHDQYQRYLSGSNDLGIGAIVHRTATAFAAGTYTVKLRYRRVSGTATPGINRADMLVFACQGAKGEQGDPGATGATGATGAAGADGKTILNGTSDPTNGTGTNGDFYINTTSWEIFGPKAGGVWPAGVPITGGGESLWQEAASVLSPKNDVDVSIGDGKKFYIGTNAYLKRNGTSGAVELYVGNTLVQEWK